MAWRRDFYSDFYYNKGGVFTTLRRQPENWSSKHWSYFILTTFAEAVATYMTMQRPQQHFVDVLKDNKNMQHYNSSFLLEKNSPYLWVGFFFFPRDRLFCISCKFLCLFFQNQDTRLGNPLPLTSARALVIQKFTPGSKRSSEPVCFKLGILDRTLHFVGTVCIPVY